MQSVYNKLKKSSILFIIVLLAIACKKGTTVRPSGADIYLAGSVLTDNGSNAVYWKNGVQVTLSNSSGSGASAIAVQGNDVYVIGQVYAANGNAVATLWKNGVATKLANGLSSSAATSIVLEGRDVYVAGIRGSQPVYWKNGAEVMLSLNNARFGIAYAITINGSDVYAAGNTSDGATYWKNGTPVTLSAGLNLTAIAIQGSDVYVGGSTAGLFSTAAGLWKNGKPINLTTGGRFGSALSTAAVTIQGKDIYVAGVAGYGVSEGSNGNLVGTYLIYWKNGVVASTNNVGQGNQSTSVGAMTVIGNDVFIAGYSGSEHPSYWKNGTLIQVNDSRGSAQGIAIGAN